jgi:hypothetical protein
MSGNARMLPAVFKRRGEIFNGSVGHCKTRRTVADMRRDSALLIAVDRKRGDKLSRFFGWFMLQM